MEEVGVLANPYTPGAVPHHLAGRTKELRAIEDHLAPVLAYGRSAGGLLVFHGPRGVGKTSLLSSAVNAAQQRGFVGAWTACRRGEPFLADVTSALARALRRADLAGADWGLKVERVGVELGLPPVARFSAALARRKSGEERPAPPPGAVSLVEDLLHDAATLAAGNAGRRGAGLVLAIDELHAGHLGELAILLNAVQNLNQDSHQAPLAVLGAGLPAVRGVITTAATFGERARWRGVSALDDAALHELLVASAEEVDVHWEPDAVQVVLDASERYPHFVHIHGESTWLTARPDAGDTITVAHAHTGVDRGKAEISDMYAARWGSATTVERSVLLAIAELAGDAPIARSAVEAHLGGKDISGPRDRLLGKNALDAPDRGILQFTLPGFADHVLAHVGNAPGVHDPLPER
jgi:hypothetical protein